MKSDDTYHRPAPAYQEYAGAMLARIEYRLMTQLECGLLHKMKLECWHNGWVVKEPEMLAKILGFNLADVTASLPRVMWHFKVRENVIFCPELEAYRSELNERRQRMSVGGTKGAKKTNAKRGGRRDPTAFEGDSATPSGYGRGLSIGQRNTEKQSQKLSTEKVDS